MSRAATSSSGRGRRFQILTAGLLLGWALIVILIGWIGYVRSAGEIQAKERDGGTLTEEDRKIANGSSCDRIYWALQFFGLDEHGPLVNGGVYEAG